MRDKYSFEIMDDLEYFLDDTTESKFILVKNFTLNGTKPAIVGIVYQPNASFLICFDLLLGAIMDMGMM